MAKKSTTVTEEPEVQETMETSALEPVPESAPTTEPESVHMVITPTPEIVEGTMAPRVIVKSPVIKYVRSRLAHRESIRRMKLSRIMLGRRYG